MNKRVLAPMLAAVLAGGVSFAAQAQSDDREPLFDGEGLFGGNLLNGEGTALFEDGMLTLLDRDGETLFSGDLSEFLREAGARNAERLDEKGADIDRRYNEAANRASENGMEGLATLLDETGDALQAGYERRGDRIQDRLERRAERRDR